MRKVTHVFSALTLFALAFRYQVRILGMPEYEATIPLMVLLGSLIPDIDLAYKHRRALHNVFAMLIASYIAYLAMPSLAIQALAWFMMGYTLHLLLDALTPVGIGFLWPLRRSRIRGPIRTGSAVDSILALVFVIIFFVLVFVPTLSL